MSEKDDADTIAKLREALLTLVDEQNGPPLIRHKARWMEAMAGAYDALGKPDAAAYYRKQLKGKGI